MKKQIFRDSDHHLFVRKCPIQFHHFYSIIRGFGQQSGYGLVGSDRSSYPGASMRIVPQLNQNIQCEAVNRFNFICLFLTCGLYSSNLRRKSICDIGPPGNLSQLDTPFSLIQTNTCQDDLRKLGLEYLNWHQKWTYLCAQTAHLNAKQLR